MRSFAKLILMNIPKQTTSTELKGILQKFGEVTELNFPLQQDLSSKGYAVVDFRDTLARDKAQRTMATTVLRGNTLRTEVPQHSDKKLFYDRKKLVAREVVDPDRYGIVSEGDMAKADIS